jgi:hypothetical protein
MTETHESREVGHASAILEDLGGHAIALALVETTTGTATDYTSSVLAAVLEKIESIVDLNRSGLRLGVAMDNGNDTTHFGELECEDVRVMLLWVYTKTRQLWYFLG